MTESQLLQEISSLTPDAQKLVLELVRFLNRNNGEGETAASVAKQAKIPLRDEPFFGMWRNRVEMADSVEYVRKLRRSQWDRNSE